MSIGKVESGVETPSRPLREDFESSASDIAGSTIRMKKPESLSRKTTR
jgi:hypothetical protein